MSKSPVEEEPFDPEAALEDLGISVPQAIELPDVPEELKTHEEVLELTEDNVSEIAGPAFAQAAAAGVFGRREDLPCDVVYPPLEPFSGEEQTSTPFGTNPKDLIASSKIDLSVVPPAAILHLATAMMDGARKYGPYNWRDNAVLARVYLAAALRHTLQCLDGEDFDPVSLVHHGGHAMACWAIFLDAYETGNLADDRPKQGVAGALIRKFDPDKKLS